jgi:hypothetical protein
VPSIAGRTVPRRSAVSELSNLLDSSEVFALVAELDGLRWTGQKGYGARALVGACLVKSLYAIPTWTRTAALIAEHRALADVLGGTPSQWACYRFCRKLREHSHALADFPSTGWTWPWTAPTCPPTRTGSATSQRTGRSASGTPTRTPPGAIAPLSPPGRAAGSTATASTPPSAPAPGYRSPGRCSAREHESLFVAALLDTLRRRGFQPETAALDMGYDNNRVYAECEECNVAPVIPLRQTPDVKRGRHGAPTCEHGAWTFAGADFKNRRTKWRCPTGECAPKSVWIKATRLRPIIPRETRRWRELYRGRAAVEREFGRLKHEYGLSPVRVRGLGRVALHADLVMLARLAQALARAQAVPLAA